MEGQRLDDLKNAMNALTGTDATLTGQFARFRAHEDVTVITFSTRSGHRTFTIDDTDPSGPDMTAIRTTSTA
jgi:Ca-activated chloride channel family protein